METIPTLACACGTEINVYLPKMVTRRAFYDYKRTVLNPILAMLQNIVCAPIASLITEYMNLPQTQVEHFRRVISISQIFFVYTNSRCENLMVCILPSKNDSCIDIVFKRDNDRVRTSEMRCITDPPVRTWARSMDMFDTPMALISRIGVAMLSMPYGCMHGFAYDNAYDTQCPKLHTSHSKYIIAQGLLKKYADCVDALNADFT